MAKWHITDAANRCKSYGSVSAFCSISNSDNLLKNITSIFMSDQVARKGSQIVGGSVNRKFYSEYGGGFPNCGEKAMSLRSLYFGRNCPAKICIKS